MLDAFYPFVAIPLAGVSALMGAAISFFTRLEMEVYKKHIRIARIAVGLLFVAIACYALFKIDMLAGMIFGVIAGFMLPQMKELHSWLLVGFIAGSAFTVELTPAYTAFVFLVIYAFLYASETSIPLVIKRKKFLKNMILKQAAVVAVGLVSFVFAGISGPVIAGNLFFCAVGILAIQLIREIKNI